MPVLQTEHTFKLPRGYRDSSGRVHTTGTMRLATARDEVETLREASVRGNGAQLSVQLLSRVHRIYGVELSLEVVYSAEFTVAELAKAIELKEIEQSGGDYQELLRELDGMSDEEVRALLAEEQDAN